MSCVADQCRQGRVDCPTPAACFGAQNLHRVMHLPIAREEADSPVSTPEQTMAWSALAWTLGVAAAGLTAAMAWVIWPLFLAAVK